MNDTLRVAERGRPILFSYRDMLDYHGHGSPGGVAHAFKILERALPVLDAEAPLERREITVRTAFGGPGARDGFELVTRAVSDDRYVVDPTLARPQRGRAMERFVFCLGYRGRSVTLAVREGYVSDELIDLTRKQQRSAADEQRLTRLKLEMADRVMSATADDVYDVDATEDLSAQMPGE